MMKQLICVSLILLPFLAVVSGRAPSGGWTPIKDVSDPRIVEIAKFAFLEHKKQSKVDLVYEKVIEGKTQVVAGTKYDLIMSAKNGGATKKYEAVVVEKPWEKFRSLLSFKTL